MFFGGERGDSRMQRWWSLLHVLCRGFLFFVARLLLAYTGASIHIVSYGDFFHSAHVGRVARPAPHLFVSEVLKMASCMSAGILSEISASSKKNKTMRPSLCATPACAPTYDTARCRLAPRINGAKTRNKHIHSLVHAILWILHYGHQPFVYCSESPDLVEMPVLAGFMQKIKTS